MAASKAAIRYATALLDLSIEKNLLEKVNADVVMLNDLFDTNRDFLAFLHSPIIQRRKKYQVFDSLFDGKTEEITLNFLKLITKNFRENILPEMVESFIEQYKDHKGILDVHVKSAIPLEKKVKELIIAQVKKNFDGDIILYETVDDTLIGGFVVSVKGKQIDASIKSQLANLKNVFLN